MPSSSTTNLKPVKQNAITIVDYLKNNLSRNARVWASSWRELTQEDVEDLTQEIAAKYWKKMGTSPVEYPRIATVVKFDKIFWRLFTNTHINEHCRKPNADKRTPDPALNHIIQPSDFGEIDLFEVNFSLDHFTSQFPDEETIQVWDSMIKNEARTIQEISDDTGLSKKVCNTRRAWIRSYLHPILKATKQKALFLGSFVNPEVLDAAKGVCASIG